MALLTAERGSCAPDQDLGGDGPARLPQAARADARQHPGLRAGRAVRPARRQPRGGGRSRPGAAPGGGGWCARSRRARCGRAWSPTTWPTWSCRWRSWSAGGSALAAKLPAAAPAALDRAATSSEFFQLTHEEAALARFTLEAQLVALVFEGADVAPLAARLRSLDQASTGLVDRLARQRLQ